MSALGLRARLSRRQVEVMRGRAPRQKQATARFAFGLDLALWNFRSKPAFETAEVLVGLSSAALPCADSRLATGEDGVPAHGGVIRDARCAGLEDW